MKALLLNNWKAKIASLLLAAAIWFLINSNIQEPPPQFFPVPGEPDPTLENPSSPPVPGAAGDTLGWIFNRPAQEEIVMSVQSVLYRMHWFDRGDFSMSVTQYPPSAIL